MRTIFSLSWLVVLLACASCLTRNHDVAAAPLPEPFRVLLLGDSISIGYTPFVREALEGRAHVVRPMKGEAGDIPENCAGTNNAVRNLDRWLAIETGEWDVIHFNFGLHDLKRVQPGSGRNSDDPEHPYLAEPERYETQMNAIVARLRETGARLVFCTTTPVPEGELSPYREESDVLTYNRIAARIMREHGVVVNDLHSYARVRLDSIQQPADVHFTKDGSRLLGERVAEAVLEVAGLAERRVIQTAASL